VSGRLIAGLYIGLEAALYPFCFLLVKEYPWEVAVVSGLMVWVVAGGVIFLIID
jgi:hypothetical protein